MAHKFWLVILPKGIKTCWDFSSDYFSFQTDDDRFARKFHYKREANAVKDTIVKNTKIAAVVEKEK